MSAVSTKNDEVQDSQTTGRFSRDAPPRPADQLAAPAGRAVVVVVVVVVKRSVILYISVP